MQEDNLSIPNGGIITWAAGDNRSFVRKALENGKNVISANKKMLANHLDLFDIANKNNVKLLIEASSGGGIPWLINLRRIKRSDEISEIMNYINNITDEQELKTKYQKLYEIYGEYPSMEKILSDVTALSIELIDNQVFTIYCQEISFSEDKK